MRNENKKILVKNKNFLHLKSFLKIMAIPIFAIILLGCCKDFKYSLPAQVYKDTIPKFTKPDYLHLPRGLSPKRTKVTRTGGVKNVFFIDFDGGIATGTQWNGGMDIVYDSSGMTNEAHQYLLMKWREWFSLLNVKITTDEAEYNRTKKQFRQKIIVTTTSEWYGNVGGVAFINSFGTDQPCWVFSELLKFNTHNISIAAAHETGHTLNCYHQADWTKDCILTAIYRIGVMMGLGYGVENPEWTIGQTNISCSDIQDDIKEMSKIVGYK